MYGTPAATLPFFFLHPFILLRTTSTDRPSYRADILTPIGIPDAQQSTAQPENHLHWDCPYAPRTSGPLQGPPSLLSPVRCHPGNKAPNPIQDIPWDPYRPGPR